MNKILVFLLVAGSAIAGTPSRTVVTQTYTLPKPVVISSFYASTPVINQGESTTLVWSVQNAQMLYLTPGIGYVSGSSRTVSPTATTTYVLFGMNSRYSASATTTVTVLVDPLQSYGGQYHPNPIALADCPFEFKLTRDMSLGGMKVEQFDIAKRLMDTWVQQNSSFNTKNFCLGTAHYFHNTTPSTAFRNGARATKVDHGIITEIIPATWFDDHKVAFGWTTDFGNAPTISGVFPANGGVYMVVNFLRWTPVTSGSSDSGARTYTQDSVLQVVDISTSAWIKVSEFVAGHREYVLRGANQFDNDEEVVNQGHDIRGLLFDEYNQRPATFGTQMILSPIFHDNTQQYEFLYFDGMNLGLSSGAVTVDGYIAFNGPTTGWGLDSANTLYAYTGLTSVPQRTPLATLPDTDPNLVTGILLDTDGFPLILVDETKQNKMLTKIYKWNGSNLQSLLIFEGGKAYYKGLEVLNGKATTCDGICGLALTNPADENAYGSSRVSVNAKGKLILSTY